TLAVCNTFDITELRAASVDKQVDVIVHHGRRSNIAQFLHVHSHVEIGAVFAHPNHLVDDLSVGQLITLLTEDSPNNDSAVVPGVSRLFCLAGLLNLHTLATAFGLSTSFAPPGSRAEPLRDYESLANATANVQGAIAIGLRGENILAAGLRAIKLNGRSPLNGDDLKEYPLRCAVHLYVRSLQGAGATERIAYIEKIYRRVCVDMTVLDTLKHGARDLGLVPRLGQERFTIA